VVERPNTEAKVIRRIGLSPVAVAHIPAAGLLLLAGIFKSHALAFAPHLAELVLDSRILTALHAQFEMAVAIWILLTPNRRRGRIVLLAIFSLYSIVAINSLMRGDTDCGCFGYLRIPARITVFLDLFVVTVVYFWTPKPGTAKWPKSRILAMSTALIFVAVLFGWISNVNFEEQIRVIPGEGEVVLLRPMTWLGQDYPLKLVDPLGDQRSTGKCRVVLVHTDCPKCEAITRTISSQSSVDGLGILEVGSDDNAEDKWIMENGATWSRLPSDRRWLVRTPVVIDLQEGIVVAVGQQFIANRSGIGLDKKD